MNVLLTFSYLFLYLTGKHVSNTLFTLTYNIYCNGTLSECSSQGGRKPRSVYDTHLRTPPSIYVVHHRQSIAASHRPPHPSLTHNPTVRRGGPISGEQESSYFIMLAGSPPRLRYSRGNGENSTTATKSRRGEKPWYATAEKQADPSKRTTTGSTNYRARRHSVAPRQYYPTANRKIG